MITLIQHFENDFLWKVILKILNSGIILKNFTHADEDITRSFCGSIIFLLFTVEFYKEIISFVKLSL